MWLRYHLWQRRQLNRPRLRRVAGYPLLLLPGVFDPKIFPTGRFLVDALSKLALEPGTALLDLGTGSGLLSLAAALHGCQVIAVDINPAAVQCARINALLNRLQDSIEVLEGDLFDAVKGRRFDVILFNPPYLAGQPTDLVDRAFRDPEMPLRFARELERHLHSEGCALVVLSSVGRETEYLEALRENGFSPTPFAQRDLISELLTVFRVTPG